MSQIFSKRFCNIRPTDLQYVALTSLSATGVLASCIASYKTYICCWQRRNAKGSDQAIERLWKNEMYSVNRLLVLKVVLIVALFLVLKVVRIHLLPSVYSVFMEVDEYVNREC